MRTFKTFTIAYSACFFLGLRESWNDQDSVVLNAVYGGGCPDFVKFSFVGIESDSIIGQTIKRD